MSTVRSDTETSTVEKAPVRSAIAVGIDRSVESSIALAWALERSRRTGEPLHLVTVVEDESGSMGMDFTAQMTREASERIATVGRSVLGERPDAHVELEVVHGPVSWALSHAVGPNDLLVVGTAARGDDAYDRVLGSRSVQIAAAARGSVAVVPPLAGTRRRGVVVGIETAADVEMLVPVGLAEADILDEPLLFLHCSHSEDHRGEGVVSAIEDALRDAGSGTETSVRLLRSEPVTGLLGLAAGASLLVLGRSRAPELNPLGTTCHRVLGHTSAPVLIAPVEPRRPESDQPAGTDHVVG